MKNLEKALYDFMLLIKQENIQLEDECIEPVVMTGEDYIQVHIVPNTVVTMSYFNPTVYSVNIDDVEISFNTYKESEEFLEEYWEDPKSKKWDNHRTR